jgi:hypothetical protein
MADDNIDKILEAIHMGLTLRSQREALAAQTKYRKDELALRQQELDQRAAEQKAAQGMYNVRQAEYMQNIQKAAAESGVAPAGYEQVASTPGGFQPGTAGAFGIPGIGVSGEGAPNIYVPPKDITYRYKGEAPEGMPQEFTAPSHEEYLKTLREKQAAIQEPKTAGQLTLQIEKGEEKKGQIAQTGEQKKEQIALQQKGKEEILHQQIQNKLDVANLVAKGAADRQNALLKNRIDVQKLKNEGQAKSGGMVFLGSDIMNPGVKAVGSNGELVSGDMQKVIDVAADRMSKGISTEEFNRLFPPKDYKRLAAYMNSNGFGTLPKEDAKKLDSLNESASFLPIMKEMVDLRLNTPISQIIPGMPAYKRYQELLQEFRRKRAGFIRASTGLTRYQIKEMEDITEGFIPDRNFVFGSDPEDVAKKYNDFAEDLQNGFKSAIRTLPEKNQSIIYGNSGFGNLDQIVTEPGLRPITPSEAARPSEELPLKKPSLSKPPAKGMTRMNDGRGNPFEFDPNKEIPIVRGGNIIVIPKRKLKEGEIPYQGVGVQ